MWLKVLSPIPDGHSMAPKFSGHDFLIFQLQTSIRHFAAAELGCFILFRPTPNDARSAFRCRMAACLAFHAQRPQTWGFNTAHDSNENTPAILIQANLFNRIFYTVGMDSDLS